MPVYPVAVVDIAGIFHIVSQHGGQAFPGYLRHSLAVLDLVCLIDYNQVDMERQYTQVADVLDARSFVSFSSSACTVSPYLSRAWSVMCRPSTRGEDEALMRSIQTYAEEVT
mgnify:CR=1 FL=1